MQENRAVVVGYGSSRFNRDGINGNDGYSMYREVMHAYKDMLREESIKEFILENGVDAIITACSSADPYSASIVGEMLGLRPRAAVRVESMCNSGASAIITAYSYIRSGLYRSVLVVGLDSKDSIGSMLEWDRARGQFSTAVHWAAIYANIFMREYNVSREHLAMVAVKNRNNAIRNRYAYFYRSSTITIDDVLNSKPIVEPLRLYDCSILCNGASMVLITAHSIAGSISREDSITIKGLGSSSIGAGINTLDFKYMHTTAEAAREAYAMSCIEPKDIDVMQVHDAFTVCELMAYEALGVVSKGECRYAIEGKVSIPDTNSDGGILGRGHVIGATGIAQFIAMVSSMKSHDYRIGLMHNMAAAGSSAEVIILEKL